MEKKAFKPVDSKASLPAVEHEMLDFWEEHKIFEKSVEARRGKPKFVFFDGPPFANGLPHYGHILANSLKDAVTRYWTMRGFYVPRVNGWDCHGLPVEYEIEKELKLSGRKDIEKMGIAKFNSECRKSVFRYTEEWEKLLVRIARWVDFEHGYATLDNNYMESIWWVFKEIWKKGMVYQGHKAMHICPRCETPLSNFEVTQGYKDVTDLSVIAKFKLKNETNTYILAWTTTPWTLPGNVLLAVGPKIKYCKVKVWIKPDGELLRDFDIEYKKSECHEEYYIFAENRLSRLMTPKSGSISTEEVNKLGETAGQYVFEKIEQLEAFQLEGKKYEPLFPFFMNWENSFRICEADFVTTDDGTGVVHIAPGFGEEDLLTGQLESVEPIMHVKMDGSFVDTVKPWAGKFAKAQDINIKDHLATEGKLFHFENIRHSYPHCWRCDTPLLNYATAAWFIRVTDVKEKLLKNNKKIRWVPEHIQEGRFGKWLEGARDWNISRNRFWGCPIPVWECACGEKKCVGSLKELRENSTGGNTYIFVRHGEGEQNAKKILNSDPKNIYHLTATGKAQAYEAAKKIKKEKVDMLFASPMARAKETADIIASELKLDVNFDQHLIEHNVGPFEEKNEKEFMDQFPTLEIRYTKKIPGAESFQEVETRIANFIDFLNRKYSGKTFVIVTHGNVIRGALHAIGEKNLEETFATISPFAGITTVYCGKLPKREAELDLHKPYIDDIKLACEKCGGEMKRIPEVLDCWFESGAMPYAQLHYPFENKKEFEDNFPANFIAEGLDQTRGWFYTLHVLATILFDEPAFKNVIVNGILLAADGEKLSKRKKNYPDPNALFEKYGADSTRLFLYTSTAPLAQDVRFSEKHVEEIVKQFTLTLWNTYSFFVTYANIDGWNVIARSKAPKQSSLDRFANARDDMKNKLDEWILSELHVLIDEVTTNMETYNLTLATRPLLTFVDNLSNWYVRRSRRRFWKSESDSDKLSAYQTLFTVLETVSRLLAPFMPATADAIFKNLTGKPSVHLEDWPKSDKKFIKKELNEEIHTVRLIVSLALRIRSKNNLKVRQPLARLLLALPPRIPKKLIELYRDVILEEINVKEIAFETEGGIATRAVTVDSRKIGPRFGKETQEIIALSKKGEFVFQKDGSVKLGKFVLQPDEFTIGYKAKEGFDVESEEGIIVALDTKITAELKAEGAVRDIVRFIQELRKKADYGISDRIYVCISGSSDIQKAVTQFADFIARETLAIEIQEGGDFEWDKEETVDVDGEKVKLGVRK